MARFYLKARWTARPDGPGPLSSTGEIARIRPRRSLYLPEAGMRLRTDLISGVAGQHAATHGAPSPVSAWYPGYVDWEERSADFVLQVAKELGEPEPAMLDYGATKAARLALAGRRVEILSGRPFEIEVGVTLPGFPSHAAITYAPKGLYTRAKLLEDGSEQNVAVTRNEAFDDAFLVLGNEASLVVAHLAGDALDALCEVNDLRPDINTMKFVWGEPPESFVHIRARPSEGVDQGTHDVERTVRAVEDMVAVAVRLEQAWSPPS